MSTCSTCPADEADLSWWLALEPVIGWRTATGSPLSSVTRGKQLPEKAFDRAVRVIQTFGHLAVIEGVKSYHLIRGDLCWFTMGEAVAETALINRVEGHDDGSS